ncbi:amino acid deaminase [Psychromonas sp. psych-6C06]|uniref:amino acid deaminase n=1 Tax=Psychromonas sp. psych-6C06 TaxID=2058089 RepID=UPI001930E8D3|nr:amino acid deaminase [Psychromonas sp. psych-6C06]
MAISVSSSGLNLLNEDLSLPCAVLYHSRIQNNLNWMQKFAEKNCVKLAPHGKTSMTPALFQLQLNSGAWAITLATAPQIVSAYEHGIKRLMLANQLIGKQNMRLIHEVISDREVEFYCLVDSVANVEQLGQFFRDKNVNLNLLLEIGVASGRCGCRDKNSALQVIEAINRFKHLKLCGVEFYEGVIHGEDEVTLISDFINSTIHFTHHLIETNCFDSQQVLLTGAGSAWYDVVAKTFTEAKLNSRIIPIIRPGCYLIHDTGIYQEAQQAVVTRSQIACDLNNELGADLQSSLEVWAYVQSIPEPGHVIIGMGKRNVAFDAGLPIPELIYRPDDQQVNKVLNNWKVTDIMDQHAYLSCPVDADIAVGDMIAFSTSHPCLTFDKWRKIQLIDDSYRVKETLDTFF